MLTNHVACKHGGGKGGRKYLAAEPLSLATSSSILERTSFRLSSAALTNSFTRGFKLATSPAYRSNEQNASDSDFVSLIPKWICLILTNIWSQLALWIPAGATLLINELDKVIQVPATIIIFTSFVSLREELQCGETRNTIPAKVTYIIKILPWSWKKGQT